MQACDDLKRAIEELRPAHLLLVGNDLCEPLAQHAAAQACTVLKLSAAQVELKQMQTRFDLAIVTEFDCATQAAGARAMLAGLRDLYARRLLVLAAPICRAELNALGFSLLKEYQDSEKLLYGFELKTYKPLPDWLNAQYWANPEMWDKKRW